MSHKPASSGDRDEFRSIVVQVVEADEGLRRSIATALSERGHECQAFESMAAYSAAAVPSRAACVVIDNDVPDFVSSKLDQKLADPTRSLPLVMISSGADTPVALRVAGHSTASTLRKPFRAGELTTAVERSVRLDEARKRVHERFKAIEASVQQLSARETKVLKAIIAGQLNKAIARSLDVSVRTVEGDRAKIVEKFNAETTGEVVGKFAQYTLLTEIGYAEFGASAFAI